MLKYIVLSLTLLLPALCELQYPFERKHMEEAHLMEVSDEIAFFKIHDTNSDGFWDKNELLTMYGTERDVDPKAEHIQTIVKNIFKSMDTNKDGYISQSEYTGNVRLPVITEKQKKKEKDLKNGKKKNKGNNDKNKGNSNKNKKKKPKLDKDYEFVVPEKFRA